MSYRIILQDEFKRRSMRNPRYSLRAFARDLQVAPSTLSEVFQGKSGLSTRTARQIAEALDFTPEHRDYFCALVDAAESRSNLKKALAERQLKQHHDKPKYEVLSEQDFRVVVDWAHAAMIELTKVKGARASAKWFALKLGIASTKAREALERLLQLGFLRRNEGTGDLKAASPNYTVPGGRPSAVIRQFHTALLDKAKRAIYEQDTHDRDFSSITLAFPKERMEEARQLIREFRRQFDKEMQSKSDFDSVYCLAIQLFRLDQDVPESASTTARLP
jgi:uncharacterized protein (TIGR02147 family)